MQEPTLPYHLSLPSSPPPWPAVVVVGEQAGATDAIRALCDRLAAEGYAAAAPDMQRAEARAEIAEVVARVRDMGATTVGVVGIGAGGMHAYSAAVSGLDIDAAVTIDTPGIAQQLGDPYCPLLMFFEEHDTRISRDDMVAVEKHHPGQVVLVDNGGTGLALSSGTAGGAWPRLVEFCDAILRVS